MKRFSVLAALSLLASCSGHSADPKVTQAWVRLAAVPGRPAAAYFTVEGGHGEDRLVRVESAVVGRIEMHASMAGGGMTTMRPLDEVAIPAGEETRFAPGGRHLMLFDVDPAITPGTAIPLRFGLASGATMEAEAKTVAAGEDAPY